MHGFPRNLRLMYPDRLRDLRAYGHGRVQGSQRILQHHGKQFSPELLHLPLPITADLHTVDTYAAGLDPGGGGQEFHDTFTQRAFPASRLSHYGQRLPGTQREAHIPHGLYFSLIRLKADGQIFYFQ